MCIEVLHNINLNRLNQKGRTIFIGTHKKVLFKKTLMESLRLAIQYKTKILTGIDKAKMSVSKLSIKERTNINIVKLSCLQLIMNSLLIKKTVRQT